MEEQRTHLRRRLGQVMLLVAGILLLLGLTVPSDASPEYAYTIEILFEFVFAPVLLVALLVRPEPLFGRFSKKFLLKVCGIGAIALFFIAYLCPSVMQLKWQYAYVLSACWFVCFLCVSVFFFLLTSLARQAVLTALCSLLGSVFFAFFCAEIYLLCTGDALDGVWNDNAHSQFYQPSIPSDSKIVTTAIGTFPKKAEHGFALVEKRMKFDQVLYDALFTFDASGHRITPKDDGQPVGEALLFGCSYTFGDCLVDEATWPWQLGLQLGPQWRVTNYAFNAFGPQQMLTQLEERMVERDTSRFQTAFFLGLEKQLQRNAGLIDFTSLSYALDEQGQLKRSGLTSENRFRWIYDFSRVFNGSKFVRRVRSMLIHFFIQANYQRFVDTYLAILKQAHTLLMTEYNIPLTVLLWPDLEFLEDKIQSMGITTLRVRNFLSAWDESGGDAYYIHPKWEQHPNERASREIAEHLASYIRKQYKQ